MERVTRARLSLMLAQPFLASAIARLPVIDATHVRWCPTAATDGYYVYFNLVFAETLSDGDLAFVLAHEVLHCVLGHSDRRGSRSRASWNIAADYAINALLAETGFTPPKNALFDPKYAGMTAESIHAMLPTQPSARQKDARRSAVSGEARGDGSATAQDGDVSEAGRSPWAHPGASGGFDVHLEEGDLEGAATRVEDFPTPEERMRLREQLGRELRAKLHGTAAGYWAGELEAGTERTVPWRDLLARYVSGLHKSDYRLFPPHRKHLWRGLYLPSVGIPSPQHLIVVVDTSGSVSAPLLSQIFGEIDAVRSTFECRVTVVQCDATIQHVEQHEAWDELPIPDAKGRRRRVYGRGGTDFRPPIAWAQSRVNELGEAPDVLIYCTDGFGTFPPKAPTEFPILWVISADGLGEVPFGDLIRLPPEI